MTFGVWLGIPEESLRQARAVWWDKAYSTLVLEGLLANDLPVFGLLGRPVRATVIDPNSKPVVTSSADDEVAALLSQEWAHEALLAALPPV